MTDSSRQIELPYGEVIDVPADAVEDPSSRGQGDYFDDKSVLLRAANILRAFEDGEPVLSLAQLVNRTHLPKSTVHRIAEQLVMLGWLERGPFGYQVGVRLFELGGLADRYRTLRDRARPRLYELSRMSKLSVQLGVLDGDEVVYLHRIPTRDFNLPTRDGGRSPAYCTALGKALAAFGRASDVDLIVKGDTAKRTKFTLTSPPALMQELREVRRVGVAFDRQEWSEGISCVAVPIKGPGLAIAAISLTGPPDRLDPADHVPLLTRAAGLIWEDVFRRTPIDA